MSKSKNNRTKWIVTVTFLAFFISFIFSFGSNIVMPKVNLFIGIFILLLFIVIGIIFDMIGVAVTSTNEEPLHAMSSKKIKGAKKAVLFKKNADKVSSFCNDVSGDICGIISGSAGVTITSSLSDKLNINPLYIGLIITAITASLTIGGKAIGKGIAQKNTTKIVGFVGKILKVFSKEK